MKFLILSNSSSGLYGFRQELISELVKQNEVVAYTPDSGFIEKLNELGCKTTTLYINRRSVNPLSDISLFFNLISIIIHEKPDFVITYTIKPNIYGGLACRLLGIKYVTNITGLGTAFQKENILKSIVIYLYRIALKNVKTVFFENQDNRKVFIDNCIIDKNRTALLMGAGVNTFRYSYFDYPHDSSTRFLFIGRVMKEKGIEELLACMKRIIKLYSNVSLDILGEMEEDYTDLINECQREGWLKYHGVQADVRPYISRCHCFVLPSWHEGMANTNLECASCGRPVITSNISGCMEAIEDKKSGFLVKVKDIDDLFSAMCKFVNLPLKDRIAMGLAGRKRMETMFDKRQVVEQTLDYILDKGNLRHE